MTTWHTETSNRNLLSAWARYQQRQRAKRALAMRRHYPTTARPRPARAARP
jgi:hypothetical protein